MPRTARSRAAITSSGANFDVIKQQKYLARTLLSLETDMANKNDFTPEEWTKVLQSIMVAGIAVSAADPSGLWGTLKEAAASCSALAAAKRDPKSNELIKVAIADLKHRREGRICRTQCANALRRRSPRNAYSAHWRACGRFPRSSTPRPRTRRRHSKPGYAISARRWQRLPWRVHSSASVAFE